MVFTERYGRLEEILSDPRFEFVVHGAHAEMQFCRLAGIRFPKRYMDTLLRGVLLAHATTFAPKRDIAVLNRFAKNGREDSLEKLLTALEQEEEVRPAS